MLMRDSLKLKKLNDEILALRAMLLSAEKRDSLETLNKQAILDSLRYENLSSDLDNLAQSLQSAMEKESKAEEKEAEAKIMEEINIRELEKEERDAEIAAKIKDCVSFPPKPPPILLTATVILLLFWFNIFAIIC